MNRLFKYGLSLLLLALTMTVVMPITVGAKEITTTDGLVFEYENESIDSCDMFVVGYTGEYNDVVIPSYYGTHRIKEIRKSAFEGNTNITSVTIPETVAFISEKAFKDCTKLSKVTLSDFGGWEKKVGKRVWDNLHIQKEAFANCTSLKSIDMPYGIYLYEDVFIGSGLENASVTMTLFSHLNGGFNNCSKLKTIIIDDRTNSQDRCIFDADHFVNLPLLESFIVYGADRVYFANAWYYPQTDKVIFKDCPKLKNIDLNYDASSIGKMFNQFYYSLPKSDKKYVGCTLTSSDSGVAEMKNNADYVIKGNGKSKLTGNNLPFTINIIVGSSSKKNLSDATVTLTKTSFECTGKAISPRIIVEYDGTKLIENTDFTISCKNNTAIGNATITLTGKGEYVGKTTITYKIVPQGSDIKSLTIGRVSWNEASDATGYEVYYSKTKSGKYTKLGTIEGKTEYSSDQLKKDHYIKIRAYKTVGGKTYYSAYSTAEKL